VPSAFSRTLRSLELDSHRPALVLGALALPLLGGWLGWATTSRAPVYAITTNARTEVEGSVIPVDVSDAGRVVESHLVLGSRVQRGDVLLQLDTSVEKAKLEELEVKQKALAKRLEPLRKQKDALLAVLESQKRVAGATVSVAAVRASSARRDADRSQELADVSKKAAAEGVGTKVGEMEAALAAQRRLDNAREGAAEVSRAAATQALELQRLALSDVELARALADAEAQLLEVEAQIRTFRMQLERRTIRALVAGYLGDVAPVTVGMNVGPGKPLATIIPEGAVRMVAYFVPTEAVGRVHEGQRCTLRFEAFPWTQFGIAEGNVTSVGVEPRGEGREGGVRVEVAIDRATTRRIPLQHGMPASVEVLVDQATPWEMLLRSVGGITGPEKNAKSSESGKRDETRGAAP
jgi:multidrug resistance efflux pump